MLIVSHVDLSLFRMTVNRKQKVLWQPQNKGRTSMCTLNGIFPAFWIRGPLFSFRLKSNKLYSWPCRPRLIGPMVGVWSKESSLEIWIWGWDKGTFLQQMEAGHRWAVTCLVATSCLWMNGQDTAAGMKKKTRIRLQREAEAKDRKTISWCPLEVQSPFAICSWQGALWVASQSPSSNFSFGA